MPCLDQRPSDPPPQQPSSELGEDPSLYSETVDLKTGIKDLRKLGRRMTQQALGWKLMNDLKSHGVGTNGIEKVAYERWLEREEKKGSLTSRKENERNRVSHRSERLVKAQLSCRIQETKEDWRNEKEKFQKERSRLKLMAGRTGATNVLKKQLERIDTTMSFSTADP